MQKTSPIIVIDSGLGGLTVAGAIRRRLPAEDIVYFGDTARVPYGGKSASTVHSFVREIVEYLRPENAKHIVIACNTATALCLPQLREEFSDLSISGVIDPGTRAAVAAAGKKRFPTIGVIGTEATVRSEAYPRAISQRRTHARIVSRATPLLVPMIEEGRGSKDPLVRMALKQYLLPIHEQRVDVLVLGCTHYPVYKSLIQRMMGPKVAVIDSADQCAQDVARRLDGAGLLREESRGEAHRGEMRCCVTDESPKFAKLAGKFFGMELDGASVVSLDELGVGIG